MVREIFVVAVAVFVSSNETGDVVLPAFELPDSVLRYALYVGIAGLPLVMVLSW